MHNNSLALPYSKAAFQFSKKNQCVKEWEKLIFFSSKISQINKLQPIILGLLEYKYSKKFFIEICDIKKNIFFTNFIKLLLENKKLILLPTIYKLFVKFSLQDRQMEKIEITTAYELNILEYQKIKNKLEKIIKKKIYLKKNIKKTIIGGIIIRINDIVMDHSIKNRLVEIKKIIFK
ncbi:F0F1 ATP synthase subunit delta [Buchnera aphidicola (Kurisakia onigurumii)]|uniref:F0F1 ATP synthase subunit delta n=1 Tax=Buchnera aphidicola TaxID=9 RepID=UPI0031B71C8E